MQKIIFAAIYLSVVIFCPLAFAFRPDLPADPNTLFDLSLQELMNIPVVISASRLEQKISESPVSVAIITAEDIHASGLTNVPEILQFYGEVDASRQDRTRYIVGVHGLNSEYSDRTLVLIDGRNALNPVFGAPNWLQLPIFMEDIERIEIVHGPAGSVWGANAYTGVINIITKKPGKCGSLVSTTVSEFGDVFTQLRATGSREKWAWRVSAGYENMKDSDAAGAGRFQLGYPELAPLIPLSTYQTKDFLRSWKMDSAFSYDYSKTTRWTFGAAYSSSASGDREMAGRFPREDILIEMTRLFSRAEFEIDSQTSGHLQWYGNYAVYHMPFVTNCYNYFENDLEGQINFTPSENHLMTAGGSFRWTRIRNRNATPLGEIVFDEDQYDEYWTGFFLTDRLKLTDRLTLEGQGRIDHYSKSHTDWSFRLSSLYALDKEDRHILRAGISRSFRAPGVMLRETTMVGLSGLYNVVPADSDLKNESIYSLEAGYNGYFTDQIHFHVDTFYQRMNHIIGAVNTSIGPVTNSSFYNLDGANAYGVECELTWQKDPIAVSGFYSCHKLDLDVREQTIRAYFPADHKAGLRARWKPDKTWTVNVNYIYNNTVPNHPVLNPVGNIAVKNRLDLTVSRKIMSGNGEFMVGVTDLLNETLDPVHDISYFTSYETPGRTFFTRLQFTF